MESKSKKIILIIFLLSIFIFLAVYVAVQSYSQFKEGTTYSSDTTKTMLECTFSLRISNLDLQENEISFDLETDNLELESLTISWEGERRDVKLAPFYTEKQRVNVKNISTGGEFEVWPEGCEDYNKRKCSAEDLKCVNV